MSVKCLCINNKNRPKEVLPQNWINEGTQYTINYVYYHVNQGIQGVTLDEVETKSLEYSSYRLDRFAFTKEGIDQLIELMKDCTELGKTDIIKLIEENNLELIETN
jgi:hypothetical protein